MTDADSPAPGAVAESVADVGSRALEGASSAVDRLEDADDPALLRHVARNAHNGVTDQTDLTLYSAAVFILQDRGYETDTVDERLAVYDPKSERVDLRSIVDDT
jgi:hypothetical protein